MIEHRLFSELEMLRSHYDRVEYVQDGGWVLVDPVPTESGWTEPHIRCCFRIPVGYPGTPPYGFYVPASFRPIHGMPTNFQPAPNPAPPFDGDWGMFSWAHEAGGWIPTADPRSGSNLLNYTISFRARFRMGA